MTTKFRALQFLVTSVIIVFLHLPFLFATPSKGLKKDRAVMIPDSSVTGQEPGTFTGPGSVSVYDSLHLDRTGLSREAFELACLGFDQLRQSGKLRNDSLISIADFSQPSSRKRLFIIDLKNYRLLFNTLVSHGRNTGREMANVFSNRHASYQSSPGFYVTAETYNGSNGYSLKLEGMEKGINDNAYNRGIVIHGAAYVNQSLANAQGYIGRSQGCPAVPEKWSGPIINTIKQGSCLFIYHPSYVNQSDLLN